MPAPEQMQRTPQASSSPPAEAARAPLEEWCAGIPHELRIGLGELTLQRRIGQGALGMLYLASYQGGNVAVKIASGEAGLAAWKREALAFARLHHPNIVRCLGLVVEPPSYGMLLELCDGGDMCMAQRGGTPPGFVLRTATGVAAGMLHLHAQGVLHRDLKGVNILIGSGGEPKLSDFGLATAVPDDTNTGRKHPAEAARTLGLKSSPLPSLT